MLMKVLVLVCAVYTVNAEISSTCLQCICEVESNCDISVSCGDGGASCGPYQIQIGYWSDAGSPGSSYLSCVKSFSCAETTIRGYMNRYATFSRLGHTPTCEDYARIHNGGPNGYNSPATLGYWSLIQGEGCSASS